MKIKSTLFIFFFALFGMLTAYAEYWEKVTLPANGQNVQWLDVFFLNQNYGWVCGRSNDNSGGRIARTTDGGRTWSVAVVNKWFLERVHFADVSNGFCSGPDGVFKSNNGGATWQPVDFFNSKIDSNLIDVWGCFMLSQDTIFVVGGGCRGYGFPYGSRVIWRSTDGGITWKNEILDGKPLPNGRTNYSSGLTHIVVYKNGTGYAASSGLIWRTTDFGDNWNAFSVTSYDSMAWHESIANIQGTNTFLVPFAGTDCSGGNYNIGGMYFTSDGINWRKTSVAGSMFGSWLVSATEGWACGFYRGIYHTKDAGSSWQLKNCGIDPNDNLDNIFFLNASNGWVVGDNIYKLAPTKLLVDKKAIDFGVLCASEIKRDTINIGLKTFDSSYIEINKLIDNPHYRIISPNYPALNVPPCIDIRLIVEYNPNENVDGLHEYKLEIKTISLNENVVLADTIHFKGMIKNRNSTQSNIDTLDFGDVPVQTRKIDSVFWTSIDERDTVARTLVTHNDRWSNIISRNPEFIVYPDIQNFMYFMVCPYDTGSQIFEYKFVFKSCNTEKSIFVKFRGVAPVVDASKQIDVEIACKNDTIIKIPIRNTGNEILNIFSVECSFEQNKEKSRDIEFIGFSRNNLAFPISIMPRGVDTLLVKISSNIIDTIQIKIDIYTDDTLRLGSISPYLTTINAIILKPSMKAISQIIDFGDVCINSTSAKNVEIINTGNTNLFLPTTRSKINEYQIHPTTTITIRQNDTANYQVVFSPTRIGNFIDTIKLLARPCDLEYEIILQGRGVRNEIEVIPNILTRKLSKSVVYQLPVKIKSNSPQTITIDSAKLELPYSNNNNEIQIITKFPLILLGNSEVNIDLSAYSDEEKIVSTRLILYYSSECINSISIPISLEFMDNHIEYADVFGNPVFGFTSNRYCSSVKQFDTIFVKNTQDYILKSVYLANGLIEYKIESDLDLPQTISADSKIEIVVSCETNSEGTFNEILVFEILNLNTNETRFDTLHLSHNFQKSDIVIKNNLLDFGLFEKCEPAITRTLTIYNNGILTDTCFFDLTNLSECFLFNGEPNNLVVNNFVPVLAKDSAVVVFVCIPELTQYNSVQNNFAVEEIIPIRTSVCPQNFEIILKYQREDIQLLITPSIIDFGDVWVNEEKFEILQIINPTNFDIEITGFDFSALSVSVPDEYFAHNFSIPFVLAAQQKIDILISFRSDLSAMDFSALLNIRARRFCEIESQISLFANVPDEKYIVNIRWSKTTAMPGKSAVIEAFIENPVPNLAPEFFDFHIKMDYNLFQPLRMYFYDENQNEHRILDYVFHYPDGISGRIVGDNARNIFNTSRRFLRIEGSALLSSPDTTSISFSDLEVRTDKRYQIEQIDGVLSLTDYCGFNGARGSLTFLSTFDAKVSENIIDNNLEIIFTTSGEILVTVEMLDITGSIVLVADFELGTGEQRVFLSTDNFLAGKYFIRFAADFNEPQVQQIIILK